MEPMPPIHPHLVQLKGRRQAPRSCRLPALLPWLFNAACGLLLALMAGYEIAEQLWWLVAATAGVMLVMVPFLAAATAAQMTTRDLENGHYQLVALSPISNRQLSWSYFYAALYRLRWGVWALAGLLFVTALGSMWLSLYSPDLSRGLLVLLLLWALLGLQSMGTVWAVVALGVAVALRVQRQAMLSVGLALLAMALALGNSALLIRALLFASRAEQASPLYYFQIPALVALPYVLLWGGLYDAARRARPEVW